MPELGITESLYYKWRDAIMERPPASLPTSVGHSATNKPHGSLSWSGWQLAEVDAGTKRQMIQQLKAASPVRHLCATLDCPTSTAY